MEIIVDVTIHHTKYLSFLNRLTPVPVPLLCEETFYKTNYLSPHRNVAANNAVSK